MEDAHTDKKRCNNRKHIFKPYPIWGPYHIKSKYNNNRLVKHIKRVHRLVDVIKGLATFVKVFFAIAHCGEYPHPRGYG